MGLLRWADADTATSRTFLKSEPVNVRLDFIDLCQDRFWGGHEFYLNIKFSIHERIVKDKGWNYQLIAPNGIHVYCKDIEEAKEIAELMYRRIAGAIFEQMSNKTPEPKSYPLGEVAKKLNKAMEASKITIENLNRVLYKKFLRNTKHKTEKLFSLLKKRSIEGRVWYSRLPRKYGWHFCNNGCEPILIGTNYEVAINYIQSGMLDIYKSDDNIIHIGEVG